MAKATYRIVDIRIGLTADDAFTEHDTLCGTLDDAKQVVAAYLASKRIRLDRPLEWVEGTPDMGGPVYYAHVYASRTSRGMITFRIRS